MDTLTISRLKTFRSCARKHELRYVKRIVPTTKRESLAFGTLFHIALESFWGGKDVDTALTDMIIAAAKESTDPMIVAKVRALVLGYVKSWAPVRNDYHVLAVEAPFAFPLLNPDTMAASRTFQMEGKIDLILKEKATGRVLLVEHKTTADDISDDSAHYFKKLAMDGQLSLYVVGAESLGHTIDGIIYDVAAKPGLTPKKATPIADRKYTKEGKLYAAQRERDETVEEFGVRVAEDLAERPARYFRRVEVARLEAEIREGMKDVWHDARIMRESELAGRAPRNPDACTLYGTCEYFDVCAYGLDPAQSTQFKTIPVAHPELAFTV